MSSWDGIFSTFWISWNVKNQIHKSKWNNIETNTPIQYWSFRFRHCREIKSWSCVYKWLCISKEVEIKFFCDVFVLSEISWKLHTREFLMDSNSTSPMFLIETLMKRTKYVVTEKNCFNYHVWSLLVAILRNCGFSKIWCRMGNGSFFNWILFLNWKHFIGEFDRWPQASSDAEFGVRLLIRIKKPSPFLGNFDSQAFCITIRKKISLTNPILGVLVFGWTLLKEVEVEPVINSREVVKNQGK